MFCHIDNGVTANLAVTESDLMAICELMGLDGISINEVDPVLSDYEELSVWGTNRAHRSYRLPAKKPITSDWIISKIATASGKGYKALANTLKKVVARYDDVNIYPASYGIGVHFLTKVPAAFDDVLSLLDAHGVKYRAEYSEAFWVKRIIISKSKDNIIAINDIVKS